MATLSMLRAVPGLYGGGFARIVDVQYVPSTGGTGSSRDSRTALVRMERVGGTASTSTAPISNSFENELAQFAADNSASPLPISLLAGNNITVLQSLPQQQQVPQASAQPNSSATTLPPLGPQLPPLGEQATPSSDTDEDDDDDSESAQRSDSNSTQETTRNSDQAAQEAAQALFDKLFGEQNSLGRGLQLEPITVSMNSLGLGDMEDILLPANLRGSSLQALSAYSVASGSGSTSSSSAIALTA